MEGSPSQYSQENLDESNDQEVSLSTPRSSKIASDTESVDDDSLIRSVDRLFQSDEEPDQSNQSGQKNSEEGGNLSSYQLARDRSIREIKTPARFAQADLIVYAFSVGDKIEYDEPASFLEACQSKDKEHWHAAMREEMSSLKRNKTWKLVDKPIGKKVIGWGWIFKRKPGIPSVESARYKARVVAKGYSQTGGVD